jgi:hypothetical protein
MFAGSAGYANGQPRTLVPEKPCECNSGLSHTFQLNLFSTIQPYPTTILKAPVRPVLYPLCFYDIELGAVSAARAAWKSQSSSVADALTSVVSRPKAVKVVNSRAILVTTSSYRHRQIETIWPDAACIGQSGGDTSSTRRKICVDYVREFLNAKARKKSVSADLPQPICQTFLE